MKAVVRDRYGSPDVLRVEDVDRPDPTGNQVLVRVEAASLNTADLDHLHGVPRISRLWEGLTHPRRRRVGVDVAGVVTTVGPDVTAWRPGDRVWADLFEHGHGALAEYVCAPERAFAPIPDGLDVRDAAAVPHSGVLALQALLSRGPIRAGDQVLVNGAGGCVGPFAVQIAKAMGAEVTGVDRGQKLDLVRAAGADHVINFTREDVTRAGRRYDLVVDIAATRSSVAFMRALAPAGRYVLVARTLGGFMRAAVLGLVISLVSSRRVGVFTWVPNRRRDLDRLATMLQDGHIRPLIDRCVPLDEVPEAFHLLADGAARGKILVLPGCGGRQMPTT